jgi:Tol biopolymer transport system component
VHDSAPFWLGTRRIVFVRFSNRGGPDSIWVVRADGAGIAHRLIAPPNQRTSLDSPAVSPDGRWILVTESGKGTALGLARSNGTGLHVIPGTGQGKLNATGGDFSPDGRWIITSNNATNGKVSSLVVLHPDGSGAHQITHPGAKLYNDLFPVWSPDGTKVAFARSPCPTPKQGCLFSHVAVWVANADGSGARAIIGPSASDAAEYLVPDWGRRPR